MHSAEKMTLRQVIWQAIISSVPVPECQKSRRKPVHCKLPCSRYQLAGSPHHAESTPDHLTWKPLCLVTSRTRQAFWLMRRRGCLHIIEALARIVWEVFSRLEFRVVLVRRAPVNFTGESPAIRPLAVVESLCFASWMGNVRHQVCSAAEKQSDGGSGCPSLSLKPLSELEAHTC